MRVNPEEMTLADIEEWARRHDPDKIAGEAHRPMCPLAVFFKDKITEEPVVGVSFDARLLTANAEFTLSSPVGHLIKKIDRTHAIGGRVTFGKLLELIARVRQEIDWLTPTRDSVY